jgi:hypothetical protein
MKKFYLPLVTVLIGSAASAQMSTTPFKAPNGAIAKHTAPVVSENANISATNSGERGGSVWSDAINTPGNWTLTTGAGHNPTGTSNPGWEIRTSLPSTLTAQGSYSTLTSTSGGNFLFIDSDAPGGTASQDATATWSGPAIDLTSAPNAFLSLSWQQIHRIFNEQHFVGISTNGGTTWTDIEVNLAYGADVGNYLGHQALPNPQTVNLPLGNVFDPFVQGGGSLNDVRIRFRYVGQWDWYWAVDDIAFIATPDHEMVQVYGRHGAVNLDPIWGDHIPYHTIQVGQRDPQGYVFFNAAANEGAITQPNYALAATVLQGATNVYTGVGSGATNIAPLDTARDTSSTAFIPAATVANYTANVTFTYTNLASDNDLSNNSNSFPINVDQHAYGRSSFANRSSGTWAGEVAAGTAASFISGTMVVANANAQLNGVRLALQSTSVAGGTIYPYIIEMDPMAADFQGVFANVIYDGSQVFGGEYTINTADISTAGGAVFINIPLANPVNMTAGSAYVIGIGVQGGPRTIIMTGDEWAPDATNFIYDAEGNLGTSGSVQWYWTGATPKIYGLIGFPFSVNEETASNLQLGQNFPNPTNGVTTINYSLLDNASQVKIEIVDVTGKLVMSINEGSKAAGNYNVNINTNQLAEGVYMYSLTDGVNKITKRMIVTK